MGSNRGFSVVEVLVVASIFGILAFIAMPQYSMYRQKGYSTLAASDLRNVAAAEEAYFARTGHYRAIDNCSNVTPSTFCEVRDLPGISKLSKGVVVEIKTLEHGYSGTARHVNSAIKCRWDSTQGGMLGCSTNN